MKINSGRIRIRENICRIRNSGTIAYTVSTLLQETSLFSPCAQHFLCCPQARALICLRLRSLTRLPFSKTVNISSSCLVSSSLQKNNNQDLANLRRKTPTISVRLDFLKSVQISIFIKNANLEETIRYEETKCV